MKTKFSLILLFVFALGLALRLFFLGEIPAGFHRDEAILGYNAYSILKTGRDISGNFLPFHLKSFIYSPAGYAYFSTPFIKVFDLSAFSVRFASAFFGSLTILLVYYLVFEIAQVAIRTDIKKLGFVSSFLLAISPWHINLSRTATENTLVVFFITLGILLYLYWRKNNNLWFLFYSFASFAVTLLLYQAPRAFLPLFIPFLMFCFPPLSIDKKKIKILALFFTAGIIIPLTIILASKNLSLRLRTVSIFATSETQLVIDEGLREDGVVKIRPLVARVFHNKLGGYFMQISKNYFSHFSYNFLFTEDSLPIRYRVPGMGLLYIFELPFLVFAIWNLLRAPSRIGMFLLGWVLLVPVGSALTFDDVPNLQRTLLVFPALSVISAFGIYQFADFLKRNLPNFFYPVLVLLAFVVVYNFSYYLHQYYIHQPQHRPWYRQEGYKELVEKVNKLLPPYKKAIITNSESAPSIFFLFHTKYDPYTFQQETKGRRNQDFDRINFGNYVFVFEKGECPLDRTLGDSLASNERLEALYVNHGVCVTPKDNVEEMDLIRRGDNSVVFRILRFIH